MVESEERHLLALEWIQVCERENIIVTFKGDFNQELVNAILLMTEHGPDVKESSMLVRTRVFSIMVECMQNIRKYGASNPDSGDLKPGIIMLCMKDDNYSIKTGNLVSNGDLIRLKEKLGTLRSLNKEDLKKLHKEVLSQTNLSEKSGAGLGLISIARKSDNLNYQFRKLDENTTFYSLEINLSNSNN